MGDEVADEPDRDVVTSSGAGGGQARRRGIWPAVVGALVVVAAAGGGFALSRRGSSGVPPSNLTSSTAGVAVSNPDVDSGSPAGGAAAPAFSLRDQRGQVVSLRQFRGKVVVLAFVDARCTTICPLTTASMVDAVRLLGPLSARVQLLGVDANPLADRISDVAAYTRAHRMQGRWRFLTGSRAQLARVWRAYHVYVAAIHGNIDHQPIVMLIDGQGRERTVYFTQMRYGGVAQQAQLLAAGIARLIPGHPAVQNRLSLGYVRPLRPAAGVTLPSLGSSGAAVLGVGHPHLVVFFASWLRENGDLRARLAALEGYTREAKVRGWPSAVAVDELSTESSPAAAQVQLVRLARSLRFPVVEDATGRLADGYHVKDLPWLMLTSPSGQILWHHDGWLSSATLERHVRKALVGG